MKHLSCCYLCALWDMQARVALLPQILPSLADSSDEWSLL